MEENQKEKHIVAILIMVIVLLVATLVSVLILKSGSKDKPEPQESNKNAETTNNQQDTINKKKEDNAKKNDIVDEEVNEKYKNFYGFKINNSDGSIYALLNDNKSELLVKPNVELGGNKNMKYEYFNNKLYLYDMGINYKHDNIKIFSVDLNIENTKLKKEFEIKNDKYDYIYNMVQTKDSLYFITTKDLGSQNFISSVYKYDKASKLIDKVCDLNGHVGLNTELIATDKYLFIATALYNEKSKSGEMKLIQINLKNKSVKTIEKDMFTIYYDSINKQLIGKDYKTGTILKIINLKDLSIKKIQEKDGISNRFYKINDQLVYFIESKNLVKIVGDNNYQINLQNIFSKIIIDTSALNLYDEYNITIPVYFENESSPKIVKINLKTGQTSVFDNSDEFYDYQYVYIK